MTFARSWEAGLIGLGEAAQAEHLGQPVAAHVVLQTAMDEPFPAVLEAALAAVLRWFNSPIRSVATAGNWALGDVHILLSFAGGQSALVSITQIAQGPPQQELLLFGNHGVASWEGAGVTSWLAPAATGEQEESGGVRLPAATDAVRQLLATIRQQFEAAATAGPLGGAGVGQRGKVAAIASEALVSPPFGVLLVAGDYTHQPGYTDGLAADEHFRLVAVTDSSDVDEARRTLNEQFARRRNLPYFPDYQAALQRTDVSVVSICAEPHRRADLIVQAAEAGKHLYLDKPLCGSLAEADRIVAAVRQAGVIAHMFSQAYWPPAQQARAWVRSGKLGTLKSIHLDLCFAKGYTGTAKIGAPRVETPIPDRFELPDAKRELTNVGVYSVVLVLWLFGRGVQRVHATTGNYFFTEHQERNMEDFSQILLELEGGMVATISAGRTGWRSHPSGGLNRICLVGSDATTVIDAYRPHVEIWSDRAAWAPPERDPSDPMGMWSPLPDSRFKADPKPTWGVPPTGTWNTDCQQFLQCLQGGQQSEISIELAAAATEILLAAYRSAAEQRPVTLPLPRD